MKILALPRDRNPYQESLYGEMRRCGADVRYVGEMTPSRSLNLLLLPAELIAWRLAGWRFVHLHWVWAFAIPGAARLPPLRRIARWWFGLVLALIGRLGMGLIWTAHNVLPHEPVFDDDPGARRRLVDACDLVIVHSRATVDELTALGARPARVAQIPLGRPPRHRSPAPAPAPDDHALRLAFVGKVLPYKGVEELLAALADIPADPPVRLDVVGVCPDPELRARISALGAASPHHVSLALEHVPDRQLEEAVVAADAVVLPFRRVTTSSSAVHALTLGRPLIVPGLPGLADLPDDCVLRYDGSVAGLAATIRSLAASNPADRRALAHAAAAYDPPSWSTIAQQTRDAIHGAARRG